jgi:elongation factor G
MLKSNAACNHFAKGKNDFKGIVDLVKNEAIVWHDARGDFML